jgi:hypothetical protein
VRSGSANPVAVVHPAQAAAVCGVAVRSRAVAVRPRARRTVEEATVVGDRAAFTFASDADLGTNSVRSHGGNQCRRRLSRNRKARYCVAVPAGFWIVLVIAVIVFAIVSSSRAKAKRAEPRRTEPDLWERWKQADALKLELARDGVRMAEELLVVSETSSWLLHEPVYNARTDMFDTPCTERDFELPSGKCWETRAELSNTFHWWADQEAPFRLALSRPRSSVVIQAGEYLDIVKCYQSVNEPGMYVTRVCRTGENRWHTYTWSCGIATHRDGVDLALLAVDVAENPKLWLDRNATLRERWLRNGDWREAARLCRHKTE